MTNKNKNIYWQNGHVSRHGHEKLHQHSGVTLWFTGLSGAGKSTLANAVQARLYHQGIHTFILDGDNIRHGLCLDLDFSDQGRKENIRRIGEVSKLFVHAGIIVLTAFISPFREDRDAVRHLLEKGDFFEIHCDCDLSTCEQRDVKGLYKRARAGEIADFTGIDSPYEAPLKPEVQVDTGKMELNQCVDVVLAALIKAKVIPAAVG